MAASCVRRRSVRRSQVSTRNRFSDIPGFVKVFVSAISSVLSPKANGARLEPRSNQDHVVLMGRPAGSGQRCGIMSATPRSRRRKSPANVGDAATALAQGVKSLKATYDFAIHTHGSIGPSCAVVEIKDGQLTCWTASQATHNLRKQLAAMLSMPDTNIRCIYIDGSGCYGRTATKTPPRTRPSWPRCGASGWRAMLRADEHGWDPKDRLRLWTWKQRSTLPGRSWPGRRVLHPQRVSGIVHMVAADSATAGRALHGAWRHFRNSAWATSCLTYTPLRTVWRRRRSSRPGSGRRAGCRTPSRTNSLRRIGGGAGADPIDSA